MSPELLTAAVKATPTNASIFEQMIDRDPTKGISDAGFMLGALIGGFVIFLVGLITMIVANIMIIVRAIEIYLYTCFSPIAFGFVVSEGGRQMTETFLKRYLAVLLAGGIQVIILMVLALTTKSFGRVPSFAATDITGQIGTMLETVIAPVACVYLMTKSTQVAKDILGVN